MSGASVFSSVISFDPLGEIPQKFQYGYLLLSRVPTRSRRHQAENGARMELPCFDAHLRHLPDPDHFPLSV
jgi:hypothetical protein